MTQPKKQPSYSDRFTADFLRGFVKTNKPVSALVIAHDGGPAEFLHECGIPSVTVYPISAHAEGSGRKVELICFDSKGLAATFNERKIPPDGIDLIFIETDARLYPECFELTEKHLKRKGYFLFTFVLAAAPGADAAAGNTAILPEIEPFVRNLHHDRRYEAKMLNLGGGLLLARKK